MCFSVFSFIEAAAAVETKKHFESDDCGMTSRASSTDLT
jgi:hypothetical protein